MEGQFVSLKKLCKFWCKITVEYHDCYSNTRDEICGAVSVYSKLFWLTSRKIRFNLYSEIFKTSNLTKSNQTKLIKLTEWLKIEVMVIVAWSHKEIILTGSFTYGHNFEDHNPE